MYPNEVPRVANFITNEAVCNDCGKQTSKILRDTRVQHSATEGFAGISAIRPYLHL